MKRKRKLLWASPTNLLDTTSGFALSVKEQLIQLQKFGFDVKILSGTVFDKEDGMTLFKDSLELLSKKAGNFVNVVEEGLVHKTFVTKSIKRSEMTEQEEFTWFTNYCKLLDEFNPDIVFFFRDGLLERNIAREAKLRNISTLVYLVNPTYKGKEWIRDVDLILTDSKQTVKFYKEREDYNLVNIGTFLPKHKYLANTHTRKNLLFINPILAKGVIFIIQLALHLEKINSTIVIEVVNSRGNWKEVLKKITKSLGEERTFLSNVMETENTSDMKSVYARARLLLIPSFWHDSGPRVIVEAQMNGIPVIGSQSGGIPEMIGKGGIVLSFPKECYDKPYNTLVSNQSLEQIINLITKLYEDEKFYNLYKDKALRHANSYHDIDKNTKRFIHAIDELDSKNF